MRIKVAPMSIKVCARWFKLALLRRCCTPLNYLTVVKRHQDATISIKLLQSESKLHQWASSCINKHKVVPMSIKMCQWASRCANEHQSTQRSIMMHQWLTVSSSSSSCQKILSTAHRPYQDRAATSCQTLSSFLWKQLILTRNFFLIWNKINIEC